MHNSGLELSHSSIKPLIIIPSGVGELIFKIPLGLLWRMLLLLPLSKGWGLEHKC